MSLSTTSDYPLDIDVDSPEFDEECAIHFRDISHGFPESGSSGGISDYSSLWENDTSLSSISSTAPSYDVPKLEAYFYYFGIRGPSHWGPKLIYRTSKDNFSAPSGPNQNPRLMQLQPVFEHEKLGQDDQWATIRSQVVGLLNKREIKYSSIDLACFSWVEGNADNSDDRDDGDDDGYPDIMATLNEKVITTPITIWVGVLPNTLAGETAFHCSNDILDLLNKYNISDIDVAYRESTVENYSGPELFAPVPDLDPLKAVIDPVTTALGLPIAGLKTLHGEGTMGFYFRVGGDFYAVTARHVLFPEDQTNDLYCYKTSAPKKEVVLMGTSAFSKFFKSIQGHIGALNTTVKILERRATTLERRAGDGGHDTEQAAHQLQDTRRDLENTRMAIRELKKFFVEVNKQWTKPKNRVIGHVIWAPPIGFATPPYNYTRDFCVVKLDEKKFSRNFRGNTLDLGPEIDGTKFTGMMYPRDDAPSDFDYPDERLLKLRGILSAEEIRKPIDRNKNGDLKRYVIKRGLATLTTIGSLNGFESHIRRYRGAETRESVEVAIYPHDNYCGPFSKAGDSGSVIVDAFGKFVALLTAGEGSTDSADITYGTPVHWLWEIIKTKFPNANLYFKD